MQILFFILLLRLRKTEGGQIVIAAAHTVEGIGVVGLILLHKEEGGADALCDVQHALKVDVAVADGGKALLCADDGHVL